MIITQQEYQTRRQQLARQLPADSLALIPAAREKVRNADTHYRFRQDSDFYYLTGFSEPDALLIVSPNEVILFNRPRDLLKEQWDGARLGQEDAARVLGVDYAYSIETLEQRLPEIFSGKHTLYYSVGRYPDWESKFTQTWHTVKSKGYRKNDAPQSLFDLSTLLSEQRLIKSEAELQLMREAARISICGHHRVMKHAHRARYEYELEAEFLYELNRQGCRNVAYEPIVASGKNACILHYVNNNDALNPHDLLLLDAGAEFENYAADITRTYPLSGHFSREQRLIYELVLQAQQQAIAAIQPGLSWTAMQSIIVQVLTEGLVALGLLKGSIQQLIDTNAYQSFYMHQSGHWLGLDVHDCGAYRQKEQPRALQANMVLTVEPGLYISESIVGRDNPFAGIGIRVEDDIRVTQEGHENLTQALAVDPEELESLIRG